MWARIKRLFRAMLGAFIGGLEDPKQILEQNIRDMRDKIPQMNTGIAKARGGIVRLENEASQYTSEVSRLKARIKACLLANDEALAGQFATELKRTQEALTRNQQQLESAKGGYESLLKLKENFMREVKAKTDEAMRVIRESEAAKWKGELADVFEQFEVAGVDQTHDEMLEKLRSDNATAEGKLLMAQESIDMKSIEIERKAQELEGNELLKQFKIELGMDSAPKTIGAGPGQAPEIKEPPATEKTIGPEQVPTQ